jgi:ubiquinone/menaquinone biosynthesis C-methylase UbiE
MDPAARPSSHTAAREFDQIAPVYDESRGPLAPELLDRLVGVLRARGCRSLLEVGVGTGRVARPLLDRGILVTGIDASREMLARAKAKAVERLVRGDAYALPFRDGTFDATLLVHVLHIFDAPEVALQEGARVGRGTSMAMVAEHHRVPTSQQGPSPHEVLREVFREAGVPPPRAGRPFEKEREILRRFPPDEILEMGERSVTEPFERRLRWIESRADRATLKVPPEVLRELVRKTRERVGNPMITSRTEYRLALWTSGHVAPGAA